jgi:hypothetical protein
VTTDPECAVRLWDVLSDVETWRPTQLRAVRAPAFVEDDEVAPSPPAIDTLPSFTPASTPSSIEAAVPSVPSAEDRLALMEQLEREALTKRFKELDRRSEEQAAEQQRVFAQRLEAAVEAELAYLRGQRQEARAEIEQWAVAERKRVSGELAAEEARFADRLMRQLTEFEAQLGQRLREQEQKLAGWWSEAERLADERMRGVMRDVNAA